MRTRTARRRGTTGTQLLSSAGFDWRYGIWQASQQTSSFQRAACLDYHTEGHSGLLGHIQQGMTPVGHAQDPQEGQLDGTLVAAPDRLVQPASTELRLALRVEVLVSAVVLEDLERLDHQTQRLGQGPALDEVQVIG